MSNTPRCRPRFKGIETFLRRIAFNLGNTASQTEVKIISCIPIDVTDLQNRICELERELETYTVRYETAKHVCHTALVSVPPPVFEPPRPYDCATGSATRDLPEITPTEPFHSEGAPVHTNRNRSHSRARSAPAKDLGSEPVDNNATSEPEAPHSKIKQSFVPLQSVTKETEKNKDKEKRLIKKKRKFNKSHTLVYYTHTDTKSPFNLLSGPLNLSSKQTTYCNRKYDDPKVDKNHSVYKKRDMGEGYLSSMIRKQYGHYPMGAELSDTSDTFSTPVCRDPPIGGRPQRDESDICSCCHGAFHNVDDTMRLAPHGIMWDATSIHGIGHQYAQQVSNNSVFYDSSLYDVVPVREKAPKQRREENVINQEPTFFPTHDARPKFNGAKHRKQYNHNVAPLKVNPRYYAHRKKIYSKATNQRKESLSKLIHVRKTDCRRRDVSRAPKTCAVDFSPVYTRPICIGSISKNSHIVNEPSKVPVEFKNAECLTSTVNNSECQTTSTKSVQLEAIAVDENKTEVTLNQIKTILQSVLTEVKTSSQMKSLPECVPKKDAVVQKDQSQNKMQATGAATYGVQPQDVISDFMNSYSYSPYNLSPSGPSCSRHIPPSSQVAPPLSSFQPKYLHNYPLFIQTTGRQCACCFRTIHKGNTTGPSVVPHAPLTPARLDRPPPATIATNTEQQSDRDLHAASRSRETDKLIQEIYKSIAVNMDYFNKNSTSDYSDLKSSNPSRKTTEIGLPSINERKKQTVLVRRLSNMSSGNRTKSVVSPALVSNTTLSFPRDSPNAHTSFTDESSESSGRDPGPLQQREGMLLSPSHSDSDSSTLTSNASDSEETVAGVKHVDQKAEKPSLFKKMVNLFSGKKKKESWKKEHSDDPSDEDQSESDDYQTIYSYNPDKQQRRRGGPSTPYRWVYKKPYSKVSYNKAPKSKRSPYMEQEYRRDWNERLTFQPDKQIYSSEKPVYRDTPRDSRYVDWARAPRP